MTNGELFSKAVNAAEKAYSKYSKFSVGAALLSVDGEIYTGCNIENSSYSLTICAERTAVFKAISEGVTKFKAVAIAGGSDNDFTKPCVPCGACLQVFSEFCDDDFLIVLSNGWYRLADFLPVRFNGESLK